MPIEKSAGAVVFYKEKDGAIKYLLLKHTADYWNFPKGLIEKGEKPEEAALREIKEETGLEELKLAFGFKETARFFFRVKYNYQTAKGFKAGQTVLKFVTYFLAESKSKEVKLSFEHQDYAWLNFKEAASRFKKYKISQNILKKADNFVTESKARRQN
jgi:8-oxo-dGTP pyrophosphatase MutT (NUDIX family)